MDTLRLPSICFQVVPGAPALLSESAGQSLQKNKPLVPCRLDATSAVLQTPWLRRRHGPGVVDDVGDPLRRRRTAHV